MSDGWGVVLAGLILMMGWWMLLGWMLVGGRPAWWRPWCGIGLLTMGAVDLGWFLRGVMAP